MKELLFNFKKNYIRYVLENFTLKIFSGDSEKTKVPEDGTLFVIRKAV